jgi:copper chaperone CopZ
MAIISQKAILSGMTCNHCIKSVEKELEKLPLLRKDMDINYLNVEYSDDNLTQLQIENAVREAGYEIKILEVRIHSNNVFEKT